jgi:hypothetical protein
VATIVAAARYPGADITGPAAAIASMVVHRTAGTLPPRERSPWFLHFATRIAYPPVSSTTV